jgi:hypothetical protein
VVNAKISKPKGLCSIRSSFAGKFWKNYVPNATPATIEAQAPEEGVQCVYRILDRQISKASGLLSYNALLLGSFNLITRGGAKLTRPANIGRALALTSALVLLWIMLVHLGKPAEFSDAEADFKAATETILGRTRIVSSSVVLSAIAITMALVGVPYEIQPHDSALGVTLVPNGRLCGSNPRIVGISLADQKQGSLRVLAQNPVSVRVSVRLTK